MHMYKTVWENEAEKTVRIPESCCCDDSTVLPSILNTQMTKALPVGGGDSFSFWIGAPQVVTVPITQRWTASVCVLCKAMYVPLLPLCIPLASTKSQHGNPSPAEIFCLLSPPVIDCSLPTHLRHKSQLNVDPLMRHHGQSLYVPDWPGTRDGLKLLPSSCLCFQSARTSGAHHHT